MAQPAARPVIRLAELLGVLSLAADLGMGQPMEHVLRQCLISLRLAQRLGLGLGLTGPAFDAALEAIADFTDVKSPYTIGHSRAVADLAGEAARVLGHPPAGQARRPYQPRDRSSPVAGPRPVEQGDRRAPGHLAQDGQPSRRTHLREDGHQQPGAGQPVRRQPRTD